MFILNHAMYTGPLWDPTHSRRWNMRRGRIPAAYGPIAQAVPCAPIVPTVAAVAPVAFGVGYPMRFGCDPFCC